MAGSAAGDETFTKNYLLDSSLSSSPPCRLKNLEGGQVENSNNYKSEDADNYDGISEATTDDDDCQSDRVAANVCEDWGKRIMVGEGDNVRRYEVFLPGYHDLDESDNEGVEDPCRHEREGNESLSSLCEGYFVELELDAIKALQFQVEYLIAIGLSSIESIPVRIDRKIKNLANLTTKSGQHFEGVLYVKSDVSSQQQEETQIAWQVVAENTVREEKTSASTAFIRMKLHDMDIESTDLLEIKAELDGIIGKKSAHLRKSITEIEKDPLYDI